MWGVGIEPMTSKLWRSKGERENKKKKENKGEAWESNPRPLGRLRNKRKINRDFGGFTPQPHGLCELDK